MLTSYIIIAYRNLIRHRIFSFINIGGLALGLAAAWMIALYVGNELSFDRYHDNADRIFRIAQHAQWDGGSFNMPITPPPFAPAMKADFPEVQEVVRIDAEGGDAFKYNNQSIKVGDGLLVDDSFFKIFSAKFLYGDATNALASPQSIVITKSLAVKIFGDPSIALGKSLEAGNQNNVVTAVIEDVPANSHFSFSALRRYDDHGDSKWTSNYLYSYLLLKNSKDIKGLEAKMPEFFDRHMSSVMTNVKYQTELQPLTSIHLQSNLDFEMGSNGKLSNIYIFGLVAALILVIASINYMNLSTARSSLRIKETGVRKVVGSNRGQLVALFLTESILITLVATVVSVAIMNIAMPWFQSFVPTPVAIWRFGVWTTLGTLTVFSLLTGLLSGVYPALFLSGFKLVPALKGLAGGQQGNILLRQSLVVFQFVITISMIAGSLVIYKQMKFVSDKDLGFNKDQVITFHINSREMRKQSDAVRARLLQNPLIEEAATAGNPIGNNNIGGRDYKVEVDGRPDDKVRLANYFTIDEDFIPTMQIKIIAGRNFSASVPSDLQHAIIINEALVRDAGWDNGVGKKIQTAKDSVGNPIYCTVVGVVKDFNIYSLQHKVNPLILQLPQAFSDKDNMYVRFGKSDIPAALKFAESVVKTFDPSGNFEYSFLDQNFGRQYETERMQGNLLLAFTLLAISIACLGLFGLITFTAERRRKEIGIRKVLGSSIGNIVFLLARDLAILVALAILISTPIAWMSMNEWLQGFAYRIDVKWDIFALAGIAALIVALGTVGFQAIKAASENPVKSLRSE